MLINIFQNSFKKMIEKHDQNGFSLIEMVIAVGIVLSLSVGGVVGYNAIRNNATKAQIKNNMQEMYLITFNAKNTGNSEDVFNAIQSWQEREGMYFILKDINDKRTCPDQISILDGTIKDNKIVGDYTRYIVAIDKRGPGTILVQAYNSKETGKDGIPVPYTMQEPGFNGNCIAT